MARAERVRGIRPKRPLGENARRIVAVRLDELLSWRPALEDPSLVTELHNMRIAAKRVRYALEMFDVCFPEAKPALRDLTDIQEDLGTIHDLDVLTDVLRARLQGLEAGAEGQAVETMSAELPAGAKSNQLRKLLYAQARDPRRLGLYGLIGDKIAERRRRYGHFQERWGTGGLDELGERIRRATGNAPPEPQPVGEQAAESRTSPLAAGG